MYLCTTALEEFWDKSKKIVFLGEWCKLYGKKTEWEELEYEVLPYHWDDRERLFRDYLYLDRVYEKYLQTLAQKLNEIHGVTHSLRYWRIVVGPWLYTFIQVIYDRYLSISEAWKTGKVTATRICKTPDDRWTPGNMDTFQAWFMGDEYNCYLYSWIIKYLNKLPYEEVGRVHKREPFKDEPSAPKYVLWAKKFLSRIRRESLNKVVFVSSYLSILNLIKLQLSLGQAPYFFFPLLTLKPHTVNTNLRNRIGLSLPNDEFEDMLGHIIPGQIPTVYLEGYKETVTDAMEAFPKRPQLIFTANAHYTNEGFKYWVAQKAESGIPIVISQHGGLHGNGLMSANEKHEIGICDRYFSWGWKEEENSKVMPMPSGKLMTVGDNIKQDPDGCILWVACSGSRYSYTLLSMVVGPQMLDYLKEQERFWGGLSEDVRRLTILRPYIHDYGWDEVERWFDHAPALKVYSGSKTLTQQLAESRLFIGTYNSTTCLEAFAANFPTVIFWNPRHWELRDRAKPYFQGLKKAGIFYETPESAAVKVNEIYKDPYNWWQQPEIQKSKDEFCQHFARTSPNWHKEWAFSLKQIIKGL